MKVEESKYSIGEILDWFKRRELVANNEYQRGGRLWTPSAKSYFIDTILRGYPFPPLYFLELIDRDTRRPRREIVDGQQRIATIADYAGNNFALGENAREFRGLRFTDLSEDQQAAFFSYTCSVAVIRNADRAQVLQMFRRMNAYTLPLNAAEKRHSEFFGEFKSWVNTVLDQFGSLLTEWQVLTPRQVLRMADAEFIADLALALQDGIVSTSAARLHKLYKDNDMVFARRDEFDEHLSATLKFLNSNLSEVRGTFLTRTHIFHSLISALLHNRFGLPGADEATGLHSIDSYIGDRDIAVASLQRLAVAHEEHDTKEFAEYVRAVSEGGNRSPQRRIRIMWLCKALRGELGQ
jgi:hypothetical protein